MPSEHFDSARNLTFPFACTPREIVPDGPIELVTRLSEDTFENPYQVLTRERDELFVYGTGGEALMNDGYVAAVDPATLRQRWRTTVPATGIKGAPGVALVHGNGSLYLVEGAQLLRIGPADGAVLQQTSLPQNPLGSGAVYNGMVVAKDGTLVLKSTERGPVPCPSATNFLCAYLLDIPSHVVSVDPATLEILSEVDSQTAVVGRVTLVEHQGREFLLMPANEAVERLELIDGRLREDPSWRPVYVSGTEQGSPAPCLLRGFVFVQTDRLTAINMDDPDERFVLRPFTVPGLDVVAGLPTDATGIGRVQLALTKPACDQETGRIYASDFLAGQQVGVQFDPQTGMELLWRADVRALAYPHLVGPPEGRVNVTQTNDNLLGQQLLFLDAATGEELYRSVRYQPLAFSAGGPVAPGFDGRFYDVVGDLLVETTPVRQGAPAPPYGGAGAPAATTPAASRDSAGATPGSAAVRPGSAQVASGAAQVASGAAGPALPATGARESFAALGLLMLGAGLAGRQRRSTR